MAHGETEALHRRSNGKSTSDTVHAYSVSTFQVRSKPGSGLVFQKVTHPRLWCSFVLELLSDLALQDSEESALGSVSAKLPSLCWYDGFRQLLEKPELVGECTIGRYTYKQLSSSLFELVRGSRGTPS
jgi:hypothetical protein